MFIKIYHLYDIFNVAPQPQFASSHRWHSFCFSVLEDETKAKPSGERRQFIPRGNNIWIPSGMATKFMGSAETTVSYPLVFYTTLNFSGLDRSRPATQYDSSKELSGSRSGSVG